jgi:hypothetical protein
LSKIILDPVELNSMFLKKKYFKNF